MTPESAVAVAELCRRLEGIPLAIELAAARVRVLSVDQILERMSDRFRLLTGGGRTRPGRQQTLRAAIDWSHDLLDERERLALRRFSIFPSGWTLDAAGAGCEGAGLSAYDVLDLLGSLSDKSLVRVAEAGGESRYRMLETIREYALEQLSLSDEEPDLRRRHAEHWLEVAEGAAESLIGPQQAEWIRLDRELDNVRAALDWTVDAHEAQVGLQLVVALGDYWRLGSHVREGVSRLSGVLALEEATERTRLRAHALTVLSDLHGWIDDPARMIAAAEEALAIYRDLGDDGRLADAMATLGWAQLQLGRLEPATTNLAEAIDRFLALGNRNGAARAMPALGLIAQSRGDLDEARRYFEAALAILRDDDDQFMAAMIECMIGGIDAQAGDLEAATRHYHTGLSGYLRIDNVMGVSWVLYFVADVALERGQPQRALRLIGASDRLRGGTELPSLVTTSLRDIVRRARDAVGDDAEEIYRQGHDLGMEEAVAYARDRRPDDDAGDGDVSRR
jgi:tetratricopeptide (TPR) repeat protein